MSDFWYLPSDAKHTGHGRTQLDLKGLQNLQIQCTAKDLSSAAQRSSLQPFDKQHKHQSTYVI